MKENIFGNSNLEVPPACRSRTGLKVCNSPPTLDRRKFLFAGLGLAVAPLLNGTAAAVGKLELGQRVGVIGLGGLGHMAVKLAVARKAEVTVFTTSPGKVADAKRLGARDAVLWSDKERVKRLGNYFDLIISTVPPPIRCSSSWIF